MWSEDTNIGDVVTMHSAAALFLRQAETAKDAAERQRLLGYAKLYQEIAARIESSEQPDEDGLT